ncbi:MAG: amino acid-binding protein [Planctomycetia bacterium]|nr:amino acid-binding protein [Planctomycetia bacterium]
MKLHQLSLFLENKPGHLLSACRTLADAGINVETMALADTEQFGILRILVKDWQKAKEVLEKKGTVVKETAVIAVKVPDKPGGLANLLTCFESTSVNIEYMYGFNSRAVEAAIIVLRMNNPDEALELLQKNNIHIVDKNELFGTP